MEIKKAVRRAMPLQIAFYGPTGSGKTFSALLFAAGLANGGKVVIVDTERGRGSLYADNKKILAALPNGYEVIELDPPYHPSRFIEALDTAEAAGYKVCLIDSLSDAWDGSGGCVDIAEAAKNMWNGAKLWNKKMMMRIVNSDMSCICLFKAQDKTKIIDKAKSASGKQEYIDMGMLPISEKSNFYPMLLGFSVDPKTHLSTIVKCHDDLWGLFKEPKLIEKQDGERVRLWNEGAPAIDPHEKLRRRARAAADEGTKDYAAFVATLTAPEKRAIGKGAHEEFLGIANAADTEMRAGTIEEIESLRDEFTIADFRLLIGHERVADIPAGELETVLARLKEKVIR